MSRYNVQSFNTQQFTVVVGWDNPLQTYWAQVWDLQLKDEIDGGCVHWVGTHPGSVRTVSDLAWVISGYAVIPEETKAQLEQDRAVSEPPTSLQQWVSARLGPESICDEQAVGIVNTVHEHHCFTCRKTVNSSCYCNWPTEATYCDQCDEIPF